MNDSSPHNFDLILVGATGFTGELTARFLESQKTERWAIAGRNKAKLEAVRDKLSPSAEIIVADISDFSSAKDLVNQGTVILSTAGPFAKIGTPLVRACVELGRDYVDITGEVHWMRHMIDQYHESAQSTGSRIVHTCGFDSVPSDLGVMLLKEALLEDSESQDEPVEILGLVTRLRGGLSGGTIASMRGALSAAKDRNVARVLASPYGLNPILDRSLRSPRDQYSAKYNDDLACWTSPFLMASVNTRVVRRSEALRGGNHESLIYRETSRAKSQWRARQQSALLKAAFLSQAIAPLRALTAPFVVKPGSGPSEESRRNGCFEFEFYGRRLNEEKYTHKVTVGAAYDPGYNGTAIMIAESANAALKSRKDKGGVLTPAIAFGHSLVDRLKAHGFRFEVTTL